VVVHDATSLDPVAPTLTRDDLLADRSLRGRAWTHAWTARVDAWLGELWQDVTGGEKVDAALVATGGQGRAELCPQSDFDLLLVVGPGDAGDELANRLWYPIWDTGIKLGHAVRTVDDALDLARDDLDTATALLTTRHLAGDPALTMALAERALVQWRGSAKGRLDELVDRVNERHTRLGDLAFLLEPDLKEARGGMRDVHALDWAHLAQPVRTDAEAEALSRAYDVLLAARVELHRRTGRKSDVLLLQEQDAVAAVLRYKDADALMAAIAKAARSIAWTSDLVWHRMAQSRRGRRLFRDKPREVAPGVVLEDRTVRVTSDAPVAEDPVLLLRVAAAAATHRATIDFATLEALASESPPLPEPWPDEARWLFTDLLLAGHAAIPVIEALDHMGLFHRMIPEWEPNRSKPQRNAYHRFTVDRHLCETAAEAAKLADDVDRPDLLVLGALFHDIGKGYPGDHTEQGIKLIQRIGPRMGLGPTETEVLASLIRMHLLLPDVATRRDLDDDGTIAYVANAVGSVELLELLEALTRADSLATGPAAWGNWKAGLVAELVHRTEHVLRGGNVEEVTDAGFPSPEQLELLAGHDQYAHGEGDTLTVVATDRPGQFGRVAGVLSLNGVDVLEAWAHSESGKALQVFHVHAAFGTSPNWTKIQADVRRAVDGRLALRARLAERAATYRRRTTAARPAPPEVMIDNHTSRVATVVEVSAPDGIGLLFRITQALFELDLDIVSAKIQTVGPDAIDAFYVRDRNGAKITDSAHLGEIERAILHSLGGEL
jgi:[protein-PII] uridylyltransferase